MRTLTSQIMSLAQIPLFNGKLFLEFPVKSQFLPPDCLLRCSVLIEKHVQLDFPFRIVSNDRF